MLPQPNGYTIDCIDCSAMTRETTAYAEQARAKWNHRRPPSDSDPRLTLSEARRLLARANMCVARVALDGHAKAELLFEEIEEWLSRNATP